MFAFLFAFLMAALLTPIAGRAAVKLGIVDRPDSALKNHRQPTPYLGGVALGLAALTPIAFVWKPSESDPSAMIGLLAGACVVAAGGLLDDWRALTPARKLAVQLAAAVCASSFGLQAELFGQPLLDALAAIVWIVGVTNAFNLIDIMDGLAAGVAGIASFFFGILLAAAVGPVQAAIPLALSGACFGFLLYNFNPASIFMGDAGSQLLGFVLAGSSLHLTSAAPHPLHLWIPLLLLGVPLFETVFISVLRLKAGKSPLAGSKDHYALRMVKLGLSVRMTVLLSCLVAIILGLAATLLFLYPTGAGYFIGVVLFAFLLVSFKLGRIDMG